MAVNFGLPMPQVYLKAMENWKSNFQPFNIYEPVRQIPCRMMRAAKSQWSVVQADPDPVWARAAQAPKELEPDGHGMRPIPYQEPSAGMQRMLDQIAALPVRIAESMGFRRLRLGDLVTPEEGAWRWLTRSLAMSRLPLMLWAVGKWLARASR